MVDDKKNCMFIKLHPIWPQISANNVIEIFSFKKKDKLVFLTEIGLVKLKNIISLTIYLFNNIFSLQIKY